MTSGGDTLLAWHALQPQLWSLSDTHTTHQVGVSTRPTNGSHLPQPPTHTASAGRKESEHTVPDQLNRNTQLVTHHCHTASCSQPAQLNLTGTATLQDQPGLLSWSHWPPCSRPTLAAKHLPLSLLCGQLRHYEHAVHVHLQLPVCQVDHRFTEGFTPQQHHVWHRGTTLQPHIPQNNTTTHQEIIMAPCLVQQCPWCEPSALLSHPPA